MSRIFAAAAMAATVFLCLATAAGAATAPCGTKSAEGAKEQAALVLQTGPSVTSLDFDNSTGHKKNIEFVFEVQGKCELQSADGITANVRASDGTEAFGEAEIELVGSGQLTVQLPVDPGGFGAGKHTAAVTVNGPTIIPSTNKVAFQRSETWFWPTLLTVIFAVIGIGAAVVTKLQVAEGDNLKVKPIRYVMAAGAAVIPVAAVWLSGYAEVEVWESSPKAWVLMFLATVAAASGPAGAALLGESTEAKPAKG